MKSSQLLKKSMKYLWNGYRHSDNCGFICHAVERCADYKRATKSPVITHTVTNYIHDILDGCYTYEAWLEREHRGMYMNMSGEDIQEGRRLWMLDMIKHFESIGD